VFLPTLLAIVRSRSRTRMPAACILMQIPFHGKISRPPGRPRPRNNYRGSADRQQRHRVSGLQRYGELGVLPRGNKSFLHLDACMPQPKSICDVLSRCFRVLPFDVISEPTAARFCWGSLAAEYAMAEKKA